MWNCGNWWVCCGRHHKKIEEVTTSRIEILDEWNQTDEVVSCCKEKVKWCVTGTWVTK